MQLKLGVGLGAYYAKVQKPQFLGWFSFGISEIFVEQFPVPSGPRPGAQPNLGRGPISSVLTASDI